MTSIREKLGVPSNLRAVTKRNFEGTYWDIDRRKALVLQYLREHQGERIKMTELSRAADFRGNTSAGSVTKLLIAEGRIKKRKLHSGFTFDLTHQPSDVPVNLPKGDPRNGEVVVTHQANLGDTQAYRKLAAAIAEDAKPESKSKTPSMTAEMLFADELDRQIWEFLKQYDVSRAQYQNTTLGEATQALRTFSNWMSAKSQGAIKEIENEPTQEEAYDRGQTPPGGDN